MRAFVAGLVLASSISVGVGWLWPVSAQNGAAQAQDPHAAAASQTLDTMLAPQQDGRQALPASNLASDDAPNADLLADVPGFAHARPADNPLAPGATAIGQQACMACHAKEGANFAHTSHALGMQVAFTADPSTATCEACHGPGSQHAQNPAAPGTIIAFGRDAATPISTQAEGCLTCHAGGPRDHWLGSVHQRNQLSCSDCHNPMAKLSVEGLEAKQSINQTCSTCHRDIRQQFNRRSHMPLPEGQMSCVDCHNPHGSTSASLLKTDTVNETCYQCHAEKRGPMLFEHAPVRESCLNCHTPHGSNQHALLVAPVPMLCQQCHSHTRHPNDMFNEQMLATGTAPDERLMARGCISCHSQVHGSNNPAGPRLHK